jgi:hypothetical protein
VGARKLAVPTDLVVADRDEYYPGDTYVDWMGVDGFGNTDLRAFLEATRGVLREQMLTEFGDVEQDRALLFAVNFFAPLENHGWSSF